MSATKVPNMESKKKNFLGYLPPILIQGEDNNGKAFLVRFLHIFEDIFFTLEQEAAALPKIYDPWQAPEKFLPWLASLVALELDPQWADREKRAAINHIAALYKRRGTRAGLEEFLKLYLDPIEDATTELSEDDCAPHVFKIIINFPSFNIPVLARRTRHIRTFLDVEKPAHTDYFFEINLPTMQIGVHSTIGEDTVLGTRGKSMPVKG